MDKILAHTGLPDDEDKHARVACLLMDTTRYIGDIP